MSDEIKEVPVPAFDVEADLLIYAWLDHAYRAENASLFYVVLMAVSVISNRMTWAIPWLSLFLVVSIVRAIYCRRMSSKARREFFIKSRVVTLDEVRERWPDKKEGRSNHDEL